MGSLIQDLKYALRMLVKNLGFTSVVVLSLALGIGANTAIFSITDNLLLRALPYPAADRLMALSEVKLDEPDRPWPVSERAYWDWKEQSQSFEELALIHMNWPHIVEGPAGAEILQGRRVTNGYFQILDGRTSQGRLFLPEEYRENGEPVTVLSYGAWQRVFGSDPGIVGKEVSFNGRVHTVVGVMSRDFRTLYGDKTDLWVPVFWRDENRQGRYFFVIGRLNKSVDIQAAQAELDVIARRLAKEDPDAAGFGVSVKPLQEWMYGYFTKRWLLPLFGAVLFVLLIACANVANLMLVRANARDKELAIRCAVGGGRGRLIRQLLTESTLLAVLGGALGVLLAYTGVKLMVGLDPDAIPKASEIGINLHVLGFTLLLALVTGVIFGLVPALMASKPNLNESLKETGRRATARLAGWRAHGVLVVAEVALSLVLLAGAGLMIRNMWHLLRLDVGFNPENLITMQISLPDMSYCVDGPKERTLKPQAAQVRERILQRLQALPGVKSVSIANRAPLWGCASSRLVSVGNQPPPRVGDFNTEDLPFACFHPVTPNYFGTLQMPLVKGREFTERDNQGSPAVAIINESFARRHFPSQDPIGKVVRLGHWDNAGEEPSREIVGVVRDSRQVLFREPFPTLYVPYSQLRPAFAGPQTQERTDIAYLVRTSVDPASLAPTLRRVESEVAPDVPVVNIRTVEDIREESLQARDMGFNAWLLGIFAGIAVLLTAVGVLGVTSYSVARRTHEIGIRMALGAHPRDVLKLVLKQGLIQTVIGMGIGLAAAFGLTRFLTSLLYEVKPTDPSTFVAVSILLAVVTLLACYIPARRATKVDPMAALRYE